MYSQYSQFQTLKCSYESYFPVSADGVGISRHLKIFVSRQVHLYSSIQTQGNSKCFMGA